MAVKFELDKNKDQLVPCKAFKNWGNSVEQKTLKDAGTLEKLFTSEEKREEKKKKLEAIADATGKLPDVGRAWFVDIFLSAFDGKVDDLAKDLFKDLTKGDAFEELEKATSAYNAKFKANALAVAKASAALTERVADAMTPVAGAFGKEFKEKILTPSAPQPAQTAESIDRELYQSKKLLELGFITENEYLAKLVEVRNLLIENTGTAPAAQPAAIDNAKYQQAFDEAVKTAGTAGQITRLQWKQALLKLLQPAPTAEPVAVTKASLSAHLRTLVTQPNGAKHLKSFYDAIGQDSSNPDIDDLAEQLLFFAKAPNTRPDQIEAINNALKGFATFDQLKTLNAINEAKKQLALSNKLLKLGFVTENEHLATLLEYKIRLQEAPAVPLAGASPADEATVDAALTPLGGTKEVLDKAWSDIAKIETNKSRIVPADLPKDAGAAAPAAMPAAAPQANLIAGAISTLVGQTQNDPEGELVKLTKKSGATQQAFTDMEKGVVAESLTHKQQQLVKLQVKKQVLAEYVKTGEVATKTQLNEFFLTALIFAALAGVIAWATSKLWPVLKDAVNGAPASGRSRGGDPAKETQDLVQSLGGGYNSQGQLVDINGKAVPDIKTQVAQFKNDLQEKGNVIADAANIAINQADPQVKALLSFPPFQQTFATSPQTEIDAVKAALDKVATEEE